jgi:CheY-like chemotaxis protein
MDCQMPEMDGFKATEQIRARETAGESSHHRADRQRDQGDRERCLPRAWMTTSPPSTPATQ